MNHKKLLTQVISSILVLLLLAACSTFQFTPTPTPTPFVSMHLNTILNKLRQLELSEESWRGIDAYGDKMAGTRVQWDLPFYQVSRRSGKYSGIGNMRVRVDIYDDIDNCISVYVSSYENGVRQRLGYVDEGTLITIRGTIRDIDSVLQGHGSYLQRCEYIVLEDVRLIEVKN